MTGGGGGSFNIDTNGTKTLGWYEDGKCEVKFIKQICNNEIIQSRSVTKFFNELPAKI